MNDEPQPPYPQATDPFWDELPDNPMLGYFDRDGQPITMRQWGPLHQDMAYKRIAETTVGHYWISTVWIGLNHRFGPGPPLIFETMVFPAGGSMDERDMERYATEAEAREGHERMVEKWRKS